VILGAFQTRCWDESCLNSALRALSIHFGARRARWRAWHSSRTIADLPTMPLLMCFPAPLFLRDGLNRPSPLHRNPHRHFPHFLASSATHAAPGSSNTAFRRRLGRTACVATCTDETLNVEHVSSYRGKLPISICRFQR